MLAIQLANKLRDLKVNAANRAQSTLNSISVDGSRNRHFQLPTVNEVQEALGPVNEETDIDPVAREAFSVFGFPTLKYPGPYDYLQANEVKGQTWKEFRDSREGIKLSHRRKAVYLLPIGEFDNAVFLERIRQFISLYLQLEVHVLNEIDLQHLPVAKRICETQIAGVPTQHEQYSCRDILKLIRDAVPADGACILAVTMYDVFAYNTPNTHVFGQLYIKGRIGIMSLSRFDPKFYNETHVLIKPKLYWRILLKRAFKLLVPELLKLMGLKPCPYYRCMMQGSAYLEELDAKMSHLCPVCLRKLHHLVRCDIYRRYMDLAGFYNRLGLRQELAMVESRLEALVFAKAQRDRQINLEKAAKRQAEAKAQAERKEEESAVGEQEAGQTDTSPASDEGINNAPVPSTAEPQANDSQAEDTATSSSQDGNPATSSETPATPSLSINVDNTDNAGTKPGTPGSTRDRVSSLKQSELPGSPSNSEHERRSSLSDSLTGTFAANSKLDSRSRKHVRRLSVMMNEHLHRIGRSHSLSESADIDNLP